MKNIVNRSAIMEGKSHIKIHSAFLQGFVAKIWVTKFTHV